MENLCICWAWKAIQLSSIGLSLVWGYTFLARTRCSRSLQTSGYFSICNNFSYFCILRHCFFNCLFLAALVLALYFWNCVFTFFVFFLPRGNWRILVHKGLVLKTCLKRWRGRFALLIVLIFSFNFNFSWVTLSISGVSFILHAYVLTVGGSQSYCSCNFWHYMILLVEVWFLGMREIQQKISERKDIFMMIDYYNFHRKRVDFEWKSQDLCFIFCYFGIFLVCLMLPAFIYQCLFLPAVVAC